MVDLCWKLYFTPKGNSMKNKTKITHYIMHCFCCALLKWCKYTSNINCNTGDL